MNYWQRQELMLSEEENKKIRDMVVFVAGAGGLGTHQILELQRIGVKKIYLMDFDRISAGNLNRQILYGSKDIGKYKTEKAKDVLDSFALETEIIVVNKKLSDNYIIPEDVDIVFDALDNFTARFILDNLIKEKKIPLIHGGVNSWYGQITSIIPGESPSLREIFGDKLDKKRDIPAFSPVVSIIASIQVIEGAGVYLKKANTLAGKLLYIDLKNYSFDIIKI